MRNGTMNRGITMETTAALKNELSALSTKLFSYAGSKMKFKKDFDRLHQQFGKSIKVKTYVEAFAGTLASLFHNLAHVEAKRYIINDTNKRIINLYQQIQSNPQELFEKFALLENEFQRIIPETLRNQRYVKEEFRDNLFKANQDFYLEARAYLNQCPLDINNAALFLFVMHHNFNGLYHENKKGDLNVSFNWSSEVINMDAIRQSIFNLHHFFTTHEVLFENKDVFELVNTLDEKETFIYLDPPYSNSNIQYSSKAHSFNEVQTHLELIALCQKYDYVMYSNNYEMILEKEFQACVEFQRGNFGTKKSQKPTHEMLALVCHIKTSLYTSIPALLGIATQETAYMANNLSITPLEDTKPCSIAALLNDNVA